MQGGTFTISSIGGIGGTAFTQIVNAPEVAILGATRTAMQAGLGRQEVRPAPDAADQRQLRPPRRRRRRRRALPCLRRRAAWPTSAASCSRNYLIAIPQAQPACVTSEFVYSTDGASFELNGFLLNGQTSIPSAAEPPQLAA